MAHYRLPNSVRKVTLCLFLVLAGVPWAFGDAKLVSEANLRNGILEKTQFEPLERDSLDINRDQKLDVADLTSFLIRNSNLVPSVAFAEYTQTVNEDDGTVQVRVVYTKPFAVDTNISYTVKGTAKNGEDYTIAGLTGGTPLTGTIHAKAGDTEGAITLNINDDDVFGEGSEVIRLTIIKEAKPPITKPPITYYPGALQTHLLYLNDNDATWTAACSFPNGSGLEMLSLELTQKGGDFSGRLLADGRMIPMPLQGDANAAGNDGWSATFSSSGQGLRISFGPIPVDSKLSIFAKDYMRYYELETYPGVSGYYFDSVRRIDGVATEVLVPWDKNTGQESAKLACLRRTITGTFSMRRNPLRVAQEEVALESK